MTTEATTGTNAAGTNAGTPGVAGAHVLLVGAGGLGSPAARVLALAGVGRLTVVDDDVVDDTNLHRQILYRDEDVGRPKAPAAAARLRELAASAGHAPELQAIEGRFLPTTAAELLRGVDLVVEGADNFATKFLTCDACAIHGVPLVQAGAVRWSGWALACPRPGATDHAPCMRCVFEDIPRDRVETCAEAGVVGPVVGVLGAVQARLALRLLRAEDVAGALWSYRGLAGALRRSRVRPRTDCPHAEGSIRDLRSERYAATCAA
ncbi:MAG TPA: ThiF family adenylyltransferase [Polyangiaceae bacterium LLY-WYZ-15_(1-7)]|nr:hypothetical protein [Myxococcales bacterium]MAT24175.1 hypothetical protein [Sandaracinus sp.]HJL00005.1 ThiF family adenylyltransferase [Polyangiaceae bacterium LLY-WYZ-15_(1-7)]MBJ74419.1 hypothetical protein [Sandaracinus sp.]HJL12464.1 ThiF family adenylyltransferase [Polyangiaceae bacterium LLY-WYZ-15_(1-7)]